MIGLDSPQEINRTLKGIAKTLKRIEKEELTHKEIRSFARITLTLYQNLCKKPAEIHFWLTALSLPNIPIYDRVYCASEALKLLNEEIETLGREIWKAQENEKQAQREDQNAKIDF